jgi:hypothetical protein
LVQVETNITASVAIKFGRDHSYTVILALAGSLSLPRPRNREAVRCQAFFFEASNFSHKALRIALRVKLPPPWVAGANIQYTEETQAKRLQSHDYPKKSAKISFSGDSAHE